MLLQIVLLAHLLGAIAWIGGMFFALFCLRPASIEVLPPPLRLSLWVATLGRFLRYTTIAVVVLWASGLTLLLHAGFARAPLGWHLMLGLAVIMSAILAGVYGRLYPQLAAKAASADWAAAAVVLNHIRRWVGINLVLGLLTVAAAVSGR
jgi:uncharacterized membrane protein